MEVLNFINKNKKRSYDEIKTILEEKYKLEVRMDKSNDYFMISLSNKKKIKNIFVRQCTGIIIEKDTYRILHYFGEKTYNIIDNDINNNDLISLEDINIKNCIITPYINGYIIKIFIHKGLWKFATSKHTNIKNFKTQYGLLYNIFKKCILNNFFSLHDFLNTLDEKYCYSFILDKNKISIINKIYLNTLNEYHNLNSYKELSDIKYNFDKYLIIEKDENLKILRKIIISKEYIKKYIISKICIYNNKCYNKSCKYIHLLNPDIETNYRNYIIYQKNKNKLFKTKLCINKNDCKKHIENKCIFVHNNDPIID
jgi:hypothetical protein